MYEEKDWLSKEIASAKEELKSWPEWMVDVTHVSSSRYAGTLWRESANAASQGAPKEEDAE